MLVIVVIGAIGARSLADQLGPHYHHRPFYAVAIVWGGAVVAAIMAVALVSRLRHRAALIALLVTLDAFVLFAAPEVSAPRSVTVDAAPAAYLRAHLGDSRFFTLGPLAPNYGSYYGISSLNVNDIPIPSTLAHYIHTRLDPYVNPTVFVGNLGGGRSIFVPAPAQEFLRNLTGYRNAGVSYLLAAAGQPVPQSPSTFTLVERTPSTDIYRVAGAAPYFSAAGCTTRSTDGGSVTVTCPRPTTLIRRETSMPGWSATIDGSGTHIRTADGLFQSVIVPTGTHRIQFGFSPPYIVWGYLAFVAGLLALVAGPVRLRVSRRTSGRVSRRRAGSP